MIRIRLFIMCLMVGLLILTGCNIPTDESSDGEAEAPPPVEEVAPPPEEPAEEPQQEVADAGLPDLTITEAKAESPGDNAVCLENEQVMTTVCVSNLGTTDAGMFEVTDGQNTATISGIAAGTEQCVTVTGLTGERIVVDTQNMVPESNEDNNSAIVVVPNNLNLCDASAVPAPINQGPGLGQPAGSSGGSGSGGSGNGSGDGGEDIPSQGEYSRFIEVYNCRYIGNDQYEWLNVEVVYEDGVLDAIVVQGDPQQGGYQPGCPYGEGTIITADNAGQFGIDFESLKDDPDVPATGTYTKRLDVYNCRYIGNGEYEYSTVEVTYVDGEVDAVAVIGEPRRGRYQPGCPAAPGVQIPPEILEDLGLDPDAVRDLLDQIDDGNLPQLPNN